MLELLGAVGPHAARYTVHSPGGERPFLSVEIIW